MLEALRSYPNFRYVSRAALNGAHGASNAFTNTIDIADDLMGDELVSTVRHELAHHIGDTGGFIGKTVNIIAYNASDALRFGEEFLAEYYGTGNFLHSIGFARGYISLTKLAIEGGIYVARVSLNVADDTGLLSHGLDAATANWAFGGST